MKRWLLALLIAATAFGDTTMQIRNGVLQTDMDGNNFSIINLRGPVDLNDVATKAYVDSHTGGGTGPGTSLTSLVFAVPTTLFNSPVTFDVSTSDVTGTMTLVGQPANSIFGNPAGNIQTPIFMSQAQGRTLLLINNVDNTSDLNKPVSTAQAAAMSAALAAFTGTTNINTLGTVTTGVWNASIISGTYLPTLDSIRAPTASVSLGSQKIINLADPSNATDATNKQYVDAVAIAGPPHVAVAVATTANVASLSGEQTINGVTTSASRILVKNQTTGTQNGIYVTAAGAWSRAADANTGATVSGNVFVTGGTVDSLTQWGVTTPQPITLGTTAISYTLTGASAAYTAGNGLTLTGNQFSAVGTADRISVGTTIDIASTYIGQTSLTTLGTIGTGTWNGTLIAGQYGGTGVANTGKTLTISPGTSATVSGTNSGDITLGAGSQSYLSLSGQVLTANAVNLSGTHVTGTLGAGSFPALTGPVTTTAGSLGTSITDSAISTAKLASNAVTYPKVQAVTASKLLGNPIGPTPATGPLVEIGIGTGLAFVSGNLTATVTGAPSTPGMVKSTGTAFATADPKTDYNDPPGEGSFGNNAGSNAIPAPWPTSGTAPLLKRVAREPPSGALTATRWAFLPAASTFPAGTVITYIDDQTTLNFGRTFRFVPGDKINNLPNDVSPLIAGGSVAGGKSVSFETNGLASPNGNWTVLGPGAVDHVEDPFDASKRFIFDASLQAGNTPGPQVIGKVVAGVGNSAVAGAGYTVTVGPTTTGNVPGDPAKGVLRDINDSGIVSKSQLAPTELLPRERTIDPAIPADSSPLNVLDDGTIDTVRIVGTVTGQYIIRWPHAGNYSAGARIALIDSSGSVSSINSVKIQTNPAGDNTFSGSTSFILDEPYGSKVLVSDGATGWFVPVTKTSIQGFNPPITPTGVPRTFTIDGNTSAVKHNLHVNLVGGQNTLVINNPYDGMEIDLVLQQPASQAFLNLPAISKVAPTGAGLVTLSNAGNKVDRLHGQYDGAATPAVFLWEQPILDYTTAAAIPSVASVALTTSSITNTTVVLSWTDTTGETSYKIYRADGLGQTTGFALKGSRDGGITTFTDGTVTASTDYTYTIQACNAAGCSANSAGKDVTTLTGVPPADLLEWHFNDGLTSSTVGSSTVTGPSGIQQKNTDWVNVSGTNNAFAGTQGMAGAGGRIITPTPTGGTTTWTYRIVAFKNSGLHNTLADSTSNVGPASINGTTSYNTIQWNLVTGADYYEVYRIAAGGIVSGTPTGHLQFSHTLSTGLGPFTYRDNGLGTDGTSLNSAATDLSKVSTTVGSVIDYPPNAANPTTGGQVVTISFWVKSGFVFSPDANTQIMSLTPLASTGTTSRIINIAGSKLQINLTGNSGQLTATVPLTIAGGATVNVNDNINWYHVVVVMDNSTAFNTPSSAITQTGANDNIRVYYNKVQQPCTVVTFARSGAKNFTDDAFVLGAVPSFQGNYDDIRIFSGAVGTGVNGALSAGTGSQIEALYNAGQQ